MSKSITTKKWFVTNPSNKNLLFKTFFIILILLAVLSLSFFGFTFPSAIFSILFFALSVVCLNLSRSNTVEDNVNEELNILNLVQASEGRPTLLYDKDQKLITVRLANKEYENPEHYVHMGDHVYMAYFNGDSDLLVVVIEGSPKSKNKTALAFRRLTKK